MEVTLVGIAGPIVAPICGSRLTEGSLGSTTCQSKRADDTVMYSPVMSMCYYQTTMFRNMLRR